MKRKNNEDNEEVLGRLKRYASEGDLKSLKELIRSSGIVGDRELFKTAILSGNLNIVKYLHKKKCPTSNSSVCLVSAIQNKDIEMVKYLIEIGMTWTKISIDVACSSGMIELLRYMLNNNIKLDYSYVVCGDSLECLKFVIDLGYSLTTEDLIEACSTDNLELLTYIHSHLGDIVMTDTIAESMYLNINNIEVLDYIQDVIKVPIPSTALEIYIENGYVELVKHVCEKGWEVSCDDTYKTITSGNLELVEYLHEKGYPFDDEEIDELSYNIYSEETIRYYHNNIRNKDCHVLKCMFCQEKTVRELQNLWYMETMNYEHYNQWFPREILEDIISILVVSH